MSSNTFQRIIKFLRTRVERVELFANDPLLHPNIREFIEILNASGLEYAICTVGASPNNYQTAGLFDEALELIDPSRGGLVFSVDYTEESAGIILQQGVGNSQYAYAFKAMTFWDNCTRLQQKGIRVRINVVISQSNIDEVASIINAAAEKGFATSFCYVQNVTAPFVTLQQDGLTQTVENDFRAFMEKTGVKDGLLTSPKVEEIIQACRTIVLREIQPQNGHSPFCAFRGDDPGEGEISPTDLTVLRAELLGLKEALDGKVLPNKEFITGLGDQGFGCRELLNKGVFPQLKVGPEGQLWFCCDQHAGFSKPHGGLWKIWDLVDEAAHTEFLDVARRNPHVWLCLYFLSCSFSVNYVSFTTQAATNKLEEKSDNNPTTLTTSAANP